MNDQPALLPSIVLLLPLLAALVNLLFHKPLKGAAPLISVGSAAICFIASLLLLGVPGEKFYTIVPFLHMDGFNVAIDAIIDRQSRGMMFVVTFVGLLVHLFSLGYMKTDASKARYFGGLSLFMFSMTGIVLAGNFIMMFVFWELVGLSSYLLIGHWFEKPSAAEASKKAFLTNRIGDFGFMIGILLLFAANGGDLSFDGLRDSFVGGNLHHAAGAHPGLITAAALCIFLGAVGKSAQLPLHVWLPDAMEGPTPVSALIHAATMVAAGVYMLVRVSFLIEASPVAAGWIGGIGGATALLAALMATQQNDIKRVLAYSTLSQLGYMVMAVGLAALQHHAHEAVPGHPAMFHLYTHAFFKAMLFLGSGAVIYACHHEQDIWKMGGLFKHMPITAVTFAIGALALAGMFPLSGFWSKETILGVAFEVNRPLFWVASVTALLTAFYMTRLFVVTFLGKGRSDSARHASEAPIIMVLPLIVLAVFSAISAWKPVAGMLQAMKPDHADPHITVLAASIIALLAGVGGGFVLYRGKDSDPFNIKVFANKFYFDEVYAVIVRVFQDRLAWIVTGIERVFVDGLMARLPAALLSRVGSAVRILQSGQLQGYTFLMGTGVLLVIYFLVFVLPRMAHS
jgi:NADH-quinone oxidoreductase subunit L